MEGPVYREKLKASGVEHRIPDPQQRESINQIIINELVNAQFTADSLAYFQDVIRSLADARLRRGRPGMQEIPLLVSPDSPAANPRFHPLLRRQQSIKRSALTNDEESQWPCRDGQTTM